jgi:hypothetical protein
MTDFRSIIRANLRIYRDIVEDPAYVEALNNTLNDFDAAGFAKLVQNFCAPPDPERADDFLFEIWICQMLRRNSDVQALQYEPPGPTCPPDFRFRLQGVNFDLQVKRLHNTRNKNEIIKLRFVRECRNRLSAIQKPWLINFWISDHFERQHLDPFFTYLRRSLDQFSPVTVFNSLLGEPQYPGFSDTGLQRAFMYISANAP